MIFNPRVTVLMPVYNVSLYINEAIESILNQTYTDFELLIIDDGSTDDTVEKIQHFKDERIILIENRINIGLANTLNKGILAAKGDYIARMDGDDISLNDRLRKQVELLDSHPEIDICGACYEFFGSRNYRVTYPEKHENIKVSLLFGCCMIIPVYRKKSIVNYGLQYKQSYFPAEDYRFWTECMVAGLKMYNIQEVLFRYRMHPTQVSEVMTNQSETAKLVRKDYLRYWFIDDILATQFVESFSGTGGIKSTDDILQQTSFLKQMLKLNKTQTVFDPAILKKRMYAILYQKVAIYVVKTYFSEKYTIAGFLRLFISGLYFRLSRKFQLQILFRSLARKPIL